MKSSVFLDQQVGCNCFNTSSNVRDNLFLYKKEPEDSHNQIRKAYKSIQPKNQQLQNKGNKKSLKKKRPNSQIQQEKIGLQDYHLQKVQQFDQKVDKKYDLDDKKSLKNMNKNNSTYSITPNPNNYCSVPVKKEIKPKPNINFYQIQKLQQPREIQFHHQSKTVDMKQYAEYRQEFQKTKQQINIEEGIPIEGFEKLLNGKQDQTSKISLTLRSKPTLRDVHSSKRHVMKNFGRMAESDDEISDSPPSEIIGKGFDNYMFEVEGSKIEPTIITRSTNTYKLSETPKIKNNYPSNYGQFQVQFQNQMRNMKSYQNL